uniref:Uncharacterized protein n=1 Tax=viral metagenome TaxID=1070528 RepID=A0A6M3M8B0_9ZZZZ
MVALSNKTPTAQLRREVEARTGTCQNMKEFGFRGAGFTLKGEPTRFETAPKGRFDVENWIIQRTKTKRWRIAKVEPTGVRWPLEKKVDSPLFPGPIAAAIWLQVEIANGSVRFTTS